MNGMMDVFKFLILLFCAILVKKIVKEIKSISSPEESSPEEIEELVAERIAQAEERKLPETLIDLYFNLKLGSTSEGDSELILDACEVQDKEGDYSVTGTQLTIGESKYEFRSWDTSSFEGMQFCKLQLRLNGEPVLTLELMRQDDGWSDNYSCVEVDNYIPGPWENMLVELTNEIRERDAKEERDRIEDPERLDKIKKKFGL